MRLFTERPDLLLHDLRKGPLRSNMTTSGPSERIAKDRSIAPASFLTSSAPVNFACKHLISEGETAMPYKSVTWVVEADILLAHRIVGHAYSELLDWPIE